MIFDIPNQSKHFMLLLITNFLSHSHGEPLRSAKPVFRLTLDQGSTLINNDRVARDLSWNPREKSHAQTDHYTITTIKSQPRLLCIHCKDLSECIIFTVILR